MSDLIAMLMVGSFSAILITVPLWLCVSMWKSMFSKPIKCKCRNGIRRNDIYDDDE